MKQLNEDRGLKLSEKIEERSNKVVVNPAVHLLKQRQPEVKQIDFYPDPESDYEIENRYYDRY